ncbi:MAG: transketolase family protein [Spirochaetes bacterium]|nr:MAG: transketolase family protein [Spirochaetota bacterium]
MGVSEKTDLRNIMVETFIKAVKEGINLVVVVGDSTSTSKIAPFQELYPERVVNVGIAEQNLVGISVGLSLSGYVSVTANAAPFLIARSNEQVKNDVCYSETNVKLFGLNAGVAYGSLGSTHYAIDDISIMLGLGNIKIFAPSDPVETEQIVLYALKNKGPMYIRMDNGLFPYLHNKEYRFTPGKVDILRHGSDVTLISLGSLVNKAYKASLDLEKESIDVELLNIPSIRPLDRDGILNSILKTKKVVTVEEHSLHGGIGSLTAEIIAENKLDTDFIRLGITEGQFSKAGPRDQIRSYYGIDRKGIYNTIKKILK